MTQAHFLFHTDQAWDLTNTLTNIKKGPFVEVEAKATTISAQGQKVEAMVMRLCVCVHNCARLIYLRVCDVSPSLSERRVRETA